MKRLMGVVSLAALIGVNASVLAAGETKLITLEKAQAVAAIEAIAAKGITTPAGLVGLELAGVKVTQASAAELFALANPIVKAMNAKKIGFTPKNFEAIAAAVNNSNLMPSAALESVTEAITEHGSLASISAEMQETASENVANLTPSEVSKLNPADVLVSYKASTKAGEAALSERAATAQAETNAGVLIQQALVKGVERCQSGNTSKCLFKTRTMAELMLSQGLHENGNQEFLAQEFDQFQGEPGNAGEAYWDGSVNANTQIVELKAKGQVLPENLKQIEACQLTGQAL